jgi:predicted NUDIX family NTP pyrophosphohydrolase
MADRVSAGILLYRRVADDGRLEVLLAHPGGPFFKNRDLGDWTIPKGEPDDDAEPFDVVARREFAEETGTPIDPTAPTIHLGSIVQKGGKIVYAWAVEGDLDAADALSNTFEMEWPPRSGLREVFPEIDRVGWFVPDEARRRVKPTQVPFIDRLEAALGLEVPDLAPGDS